MTSCDFDGIFYRVFCVTLLAIALIFTIILTNVFVDIDGLLTNERGVPHKNSDTTIRHNDDEDFTFTPEPYQENENNEDVYRSKRSLETKNFLFHIKNPQMKSILTDRLATLLDELDAGTASTNRSQSESELSVEKNKEDKTNTREDKEQIEDLLHSDIHKVLLRGLIGHMDFNEVYDRVHTIFSKSDKTKVETTTQVSKEVENPKPVLSNEEQKIFNEIMNCKELRDQVIDATRKVKDNRRKNDTPKGPKVIIKTLIDISSLPGSLPNKPETKSNDNVKGLIKLIYNGRSIKFSRIDDEETTNIPIKLENTNNIPKKRIHKYYEPQTMNKEEQSKDINKFIQEYIKHNKNYEEMSEVKQEMKRIKRHIKIRYDNEDGKAEDISQKSKAPIKKDDDELFVEIETHFDSKGAKGEKKKKLIRNLIEKIQKAIHSKPEGSKKKLTHLHIKKRIQDPLNHKNKDRLINKMSLPYDAVIHRHVDPIGKLLPIHEPLIYMIDKSSETFNKKYGPKFLAVTKAINSAEMSKIDVDYDKVMNLNGIPERIQKPLNADDSEETHNYNTYNDMGKLKFFVKDIDGSGFSIGFNQYVDAPPDKEAMKLFTGLENIIQTYHQTYDQTDTPNEMEKDELLKDKYEESDKLPIGHAVLRRSVDNRFGDDHHSNEYKIIYNSKFLPYQNYEDIFKSKLNKVQDADTTKFTKSDDKITKNTLIVDEDIFNKSLNPSEIFGLANLIHRKKRSINVNRISSLKSKRKINRYLNTKAMATKLIFLNKKRNKRQVNKIRIIATDARPKLRRHSEEEIFVVSDENLLADRAIVREVVTPEIGQEKIEEDHYDFISPYIYEEQPEHPFITNTFDGKSRHNVLMSKYPHIFMDEISRSKEDNLPEYPLIFNSYDNLIPKSTVTEPTTPQTTSIKNIPLPKVEEIVNAIAPQSGKTNYKVTVKIMPKNLTDMNPAFKEIHTSINKSYNKNGLLYSSLVNVSEISKVVKINKTEKQIKAEPSTQSPIISQMMRQREKVNSLLKQHKDRINEQLQHLNKEKEKLDNMALTTESDFENVTHDQYVEVVLPLDPPKVLRLTKEEVNKLAIASLLRSYDKPVSIPLTTTKPSTTASLTTTTTYATTKYPSTTTPTTTESTKQIERQLIEQKTKMIKNIEKNGNLTNEILKKIDRNTEILQAFLQKLTDNINSIIPKHEEESKKREEYDIHHLKETIHHLGHPFNEAVPNDTHVTIPFVYAYQQPYPVANKRDNSVASVIYQGHIHTNAINKRRTEGWQTKEDKKNIKRDNLKNGRPDANQTRFFIDELENDFKVIPVGVDKKNDYVKSLNNTNVR